MGGGPEKLGEKLSDEIVTTNGVSNKVKVGKGYTKRVFYIVLADFDRTRVKNVYSKAKNLEGINVILESSKGSWHLWNLSLRSFDECLKKTMKGATDSKHCQSFVNKGRMVLRTSSKDFKKRGIYKEKPRFHQTIYNDSSIPQSFPHFWLAKEKLEAKFKEEKLENFCFTGNGLEAHKYVSFTDKGKVLLEEKNG